MSVINMTDATGDATKRDIKQTLESAIEDVGKYGAFEKGKKVLILALDDTSEGYDVTWVQGGMKMSECLTLCEVAKTLFLSEMGYLNFEDKP